jgi:hypothetical protein
VGAGLEIEPNSFEVFLAKAAEGVVHGRGWSCILSTFELGESCVASVAVLDDALVVGSPLWWPSRIPVSRCKTSVTTGQTASPMPQ